MNVYISFWQLLNQKGIVIPIIQRDYAQGREDKEYVRKNFLEQIGKVLGVIPTDNEKPSGSMDFVYGTENLNPFNADINCIEPIDGQQRLTTLWLLHWYIAFVIGELKSQEVSGTLKRFSYETRTSSRDLCEKLCELEYSFELCRYCRTCEQKSCENSITDYIQQQTWFLSSWNQDPTIQAMLRMLKGAKNNVTDGIEKLFYQATLEQMKQYWRILIDDKCPIKFQYLKLESSDLPVSDDLYIKMNARGKALSSFENFKADLVDWLQKNHSDKWASYASLIDNRWTDVIWLFRRQDTGDIDEIFFGFFNRFIVNYLCTQRKAGASQYEEDYLYTAADIENEKVPAFDECYGTFRDEKNNKRTDDTRNFYKNFDNYKQIIDIDLLDSINRLFTNLPTDSEVAKEVFPQYDTDQGYFYSDRSGTLINKIASVSQPVRVRQFAVYKYFDKCDKSHKYNSLSFGRWMRVVDNIINNADISTITAMVAHLRLIDEIGEEAHDIYSFLKDKGQTIKSKASKEQVQEEIEKATQILSANQTDLLPNEPFDWCPKEWMNNGIWNWESAIIYAEEYAFFNGAIRFLYRNDENKPQWSDYRTKWEFVYYNEQGNPNGIFTSDGLLEAHYPEINKKLLVFSNNWDTHLKRKYLFGLSCANWRRILLDENFAGPINSLLLSSEPQSSSFDYSDIINLLQLDDVWSFIRSNKYQEYYQLEWRDHSPCLWLSRRPYDTLRLRKTPLDNFIVQEHKAEVIKLLDESFVSVCGDIFFRNSASHHNFTYLKDDTKHYFRLQTWAYVEKCDPNFHVIKNEIGKPRFCKELSSIDAEAFTALLETLISQEVSFINEQIDDNVTGNLEQ